MDARSTGSPTVPALALGNLRNRTRTEDDDFIQDVNDDLDGYEEYEEEETEMEEFLSSERLSILTGEDDLSKVYRLDLQVDSTNDSLAALGEKLPNLVELRLTNSTVPMIRDLGTQLNSVRILWLSRCNVKDVNGIFGLSSLKEVYLAFNEVSELGGFASMESLEVIDLEGNKVDDMIEVQYLGTCPRLTALSLEGNPVNRLMNYRAEVCQVIPTLETLDDLPVNEVDRAGALKSDGDPLDVEVALDDEMAELAKSLNIEKDTVVQGIKYARCGIDSTEDPSGNKVVLSAPCTPRTVETMGNRARQGSSRSQPSARPGSSSARSMAFVRPSSANNMTPRVGFTSSAASGRKTSARGERLPSGVRPAVTVAVTKANHKDDDEEEIVRSDLTYGTQGALCGNPMKALRSRKMELEYSKEPEEEPAADVKSKGKMDSDNLLEELRRWKMETNTLVSVADESDNAGAGLDESLRGEYVPRSERSVFDILDDNDNDDDFDKFFDDPEPLEPIEPIALIEELKSREGIQADPAWDNKAKIRTDTILQPSETRVVLDGRNPRPPPQSPTVERRRSGDGVFGGKKRSPPSRKMLGNENGTPLVEGGAHAPEGTCPPHAPEALVVGRLRPRASHHLRLSREHGDD